MNLSRERALDTFLIVCTTILVGAVVRREFFPPPTADARATQHEYIENWKDLLPASISLGNPAAKIVILEFADLECPGCRKFHSTLAAARAKYGSEVAYAFIHYPLDQHRFAKVAARALECAHDQGRADEFLTLVYELQDSIGLKTWASFGQSAAVPSIPQFVSCVESREEVPRINAGIDFGSRIQVRATPTVIVNGWRFDQTPTEPELTKAMDAIRNQRPPFQEYTSRRID
jgi:protein-disulfide isomerase